MNEFLAMMHDVTAQPFSFMHINNQEADPAKRFKSGWVGDVESYKGRDLSGRTDVAGLEGGPKGKASKAVMPQGLSISPRLCPSSSTLLM